MYNKPNSRIWSVNLIPRDWKVVKLKEVIIDTLPGEWGGENPSEDSVLCWVIRGTDFSDVGYKLDDLPKRYIPRNRLERIKLQPGDILVEISGGSRDQPTGRILLVDNSIIKSSKYPMIYTNFVRKIKIMESCVHNRFFFYYWSWLYQRGRTAIHENRTVNIRNFQLNNFLLSEQIPLPPLPEQKKIAEILRTVDEAIEKVEEAIERTERLKKGLMQELLTKGIGHREFKDTDIGRIPKEWEMVRLGEISLKIQSINAKILPSFKYVDISSIDNRFFKIKSWVEIEGQTAPSRARKLIEKGDVLFATTRPYLKNIAIVPEELHGHICSTGFCVIRANSQKADYRWIFYNVVTERFIRKVSAKMKGATYPAVSDDDVLSERIPLPPLSEQKKIVEILITVDKKLELLREKKKTLEQLKKGFMNDLLTGRRRVKVEPPKETLF